MRALLVLLASLACAGALAQEYPVKPVRVVIPYPPGGVDVSVRLLMPAIERELGQPWVLDYRSGAGGLIGHEHVARSAPDGYTLIATVSNPWIILPSLRRVTPYDPIKDFTPITMGYEGANLIVAHPSFPAGNFRELIEHAKRNPAKVAFATSGIGSAQHIDGENIKRLAGADMIHAPFQGFGPMIPAMLGGQVPVGFITFQIARPLVAAGKLKIVAITNSANIDKALWPPGVQPVDEVLPGFVPMPAWQAYGGPAGLPRPIVLRTQRAIAKALDEPAIVKQFAEDRIMKLGMPPDDFERRLKAEYTLVRNAIKAAGIPPQE
jgi:tripartite-type tricarboxylate transporter receptor subunit TctC